MLEEAKTEETMTGGDVLVDAKVPTKARPPVAPPEDAKLLRLEEVAHLLRVTTRSVRRLIDAGKMKAVTVTVGGALRIARPEVTRYLRDAEFVVRAEEIDADASAEEAGRREANRARVKADWNTGEDPFEEAPKRKGRGIR